MANYFHASDNCPDGIRLSDATSSKIGLFGVTPVGQQAAAAALTAASDATAIAAAVNTINDSLKKLGFIA
jgi:hypothetical protein